MEGWFDGKGIIVFSGTHLGLGLPIGWYSVWKNTVLCVWMGTVHFALVETSLLECVVSKGDCWKIFFC